MFRTILKVGVASAILSLAAAAFAQQNAAPATQPVPYVNRAGRATGGSGRRPIAGRHRQRNLPV